MRNALLAIAIVCTACGGGGNAPNAGYQVDVPDAGPANTCCIEGWTSPGREQIVALFCTGNDTAEPDEIATVLEARTKLTGEDCTYWTLQNVATGVEHRFVSCDVGPNTICSQRH